MTHSVSSYDLLDHCLQVLLKKRLNLFNQQQMHLFLHRRRNLPNQQMHLFLPKSSLRLHHLLEDRLDLEQK